VWADVGAWKEEHPNEPFQWSTIATKSVQNYNHTKHSTIRMTPMTAEYGSREQRKDATSMTREDLDQLISERLAKGAEAMEKRRNQHIRKQIKVVTDQWVRVYRFSGWTS